MMWWYNGPFDGGHWWMFGIGFLFMLAFWAVVIALVVWAIRQFRPSDKAGSALSILQERFARGEIDRQEYEQRKSLLQR
jgi:putative membrane protein